jgi:predicted small secreted protein
MMKTFRAAVVLIAAAAALSACVVEGPGRPRCVGGHYGPEGGWHPAHCV